MKAVFLLGPTASGKSGLALALAQRLPFEIVSVDSAQVYRGMDVGTAKPGAAERERVAHHLIDLVDPTDAYSAGRFRDDALRVAADIHARGRIPLFAGGTMMYFRALDRGIADLPAADPGVREAIEREAASQGWPALHARLAGIDPRAAARIEPTDAQRIQRALEVHELTGRALSELQEESGAQPLPFDALRLALEPSDRGALHARIDRRLAAMLEAGLVQELEALRQRFALSARMPAMRCVGYRQAWEVLEGARPAGTLHSRAAAATRQLAKRQLTWQRTMPGLERLDCLQPGLERAAAERVARFLGEG